MFLNIDLLIFRVEVGFHSPLSNKEKFGLGFFKMVDVGVGDTLEFNELNKFDISSQFHLNHLEL